MADWPTIATPDFGTEEEVYLPQVRTPFEGGYVQSRPQNSRATRKFPLGWSVISNADYGTLETFFIANQGGEFNWTHPITSTQYVCRFSENSLKSTWAAPGYRTCSCPIETV